MKNFIKSFSIYGLFPVFGKFISIILLPLYTRVLTPEDYGAQDVLIQLAIFLTFLINLELYSGVGRYFYDKKDIIEKKKLISTGLWLTLIFGITIVTLALFFNNGIYNLFFDTPKHKTAFYLTIIWAPISALYAYLTVVMRYEQKPKLYFALSNIQLLIRILSTILFVLVFRLGVMGVILGHIVGEISAVLMLGYFLRKYFGFYFDKIDLKSILSFSLPMVPSVLIISFQKPLIRYLTVNFLSIVDLGYYTIAIQIASILSFVQFGLQTSWEPFLYEILQKSDYEKEVKRIYNLFLGITSLICLLIILNSKLLLKILTNPSYYPAASIIGFVSITSMLDIIRQISGCGPVVAKKTKYLKLYGIICITIFSDIFYYFTQTNRNNRIIYCFFRRKFN
jgi:O-antigen/teichoic acid export membrane protein